jgi:hypothetical protein
MARAQFHKNQRVYVRPVGTWTLVERVVPQWTKGLEEPIRIYYDVGLGREFAAEELQSEQATPPEGADGHERWRIVRIANTIQTALDTVAHPHPGTCPAVVTGDAEWGGWRVPAMEYAISPDRIEHQARLIAVAPLLATLLQKFDTWTRLSPNEVPPGLRDLAQESSKALAYLKDGFS